MKELQMQLSNLQGKRNNLIVLLRTKQKTNVPKTMDRLKECNREISKVRKQLRKGS